MKTVLFCNTQNEQCGVYQYGRHLFDALYQSTEFDFVYIQPGSAEQLTVEVVKHMPVAVLYNWHPDQGGWMKEAPLWFPTKARVRQYLVYHDWDADVSKFDGVMFSDPTMPDHDNWYAIPRPLPQWTPLPLEPPDEKCPVLGVHGFGGASADWLVTRAMDEFDWAVLRLHLPSAHYGDADGVTARNMADLCRKHASRKPGIELQISHHWMSVPRMMHWLSFNDMNVYLRDPAAHWRGVSSALDAALAVRRPLAVNKCEGFRHVFGCEPSICVEDRSLKDILATGVAPLTKVYEHNSSEHLRRRVEQILSL
jgi:hypothetical protein